MNITFNVIKFIVLLLWLKTRSAQACRARPEQDVNLSEIMTRKATVQDLKMCK